MLDKAKIHAEASRLTGVRARMLKVFPFFGRLLLRLRFGFSECGTAFTDMRQVVFDPEFAERLDDNGLSFVLLHELMHCVLHHCTRGRGLVPLIYNIACDIVVNSIILEMMGVSSYEIDGEEVMHLAPDGSEGRELTAEAVYRQLIREYSPGAAAPGNGKGTLDDHSVWESVDKSAADVWDGYVREAAKHVSSGGAPGFIERQLLGFAESPKVNWRQLLNDFISCCRGDFTYLTPDRRFQGDFIMPSFMEDIDGEKIEKLWILIDASGSVSDRELTEAVNEIRCALRLIDNVSGWISYFDSAVSSPAPFETEEEFMGVKPVGGGGTSFTAIFDRLKADFSEDPPRAMVILTDGQARWPNEEAAMDVPVLWILIDCPEDAPWGVSVHVDGEEY